MTAAQYAYSVSANTTPFSVIPGGFANFTFANCTPGETMEKANTTHITWVLRDCFSNEIFCARQDVSTDHAALYAQLICERPLIENHVYETLRVSVPQSTTKTLKQASAPAKMAEHRLGVARGSHIMTTRGELPVERLKAGDRVITRDHGMQVVRWVGANKVTVTAENAPILFRKGAIKNARDLIVSPDHRIVLKGTDAMMQYGVKEVLVPARKLVNGDTIVQAVGGKIEFYQILTDQHEVVYIEAAAVESFMPSLDALARLPKETRDEVFSALPVLAVSPESYGPCARGFVETDAR